MILFLSKLAENKLDHILLYILENWGIKERNNFIKLLTSKFNQLILFPESCPKSQSHPNLYKGVLSKQTIFFYQIKNNTEIEIITFFDTRQNPDKLKSEIS